MLGICSTASWSAASTMQGAFHSFIGWSPALRAVPAFLEYAYRRHRAQLAAAETSQLSVCNLYYKML